MFLSILLQSYGRYDHHEPSWLDGAFSAWYWDLGNWYFITIALMIVLAPLIKFWNWISDLFQGPPEIEPLEEVSIERLRKEREMKKMNEEFRRFMKDKKRSVEEKDAFRDEWWERYIKLNGLD